MSASQNGRAPEWLTLSWLNHNGSSDRPTYRRRKFTIHQSLGDILNLNPEVALNGRRSIINRGLLNLISAVKNIKSDSSFFAM